MPRKPLNGREVEIHYSNGYSREIFREEAAECLNQYRNAAKRNPQVRLAARSCLEFPQYCLKIRNYSFEIQGHFADPQVRIRIKDYRTAGKDTK